MLVNNPKFPLAYETAGDSFRIQAEHLQDWIDQAEDDNPAMLTEAERAFLETCREAIPVIIVNSRLYMKLAALCQQMIDEGQGQGQREQGSCDCD
ncbi:hypothetical protein CA85_40300 [Allorhodopirellula solitaria]|uniref:Uncharacterized protein n=1 Tax=Allorhodopirellula solitaria TaxID=2527987 RepID=A0A5C5X1L8_9BACT|nr:hypothetical protein CA85_40300 [Allorhodopirellula solitaria]